MFVILSGDSQLILWLSEDELLQTEAVRDCGLSMNSWTTWVWQEDETIRSRKRLCLHMDLQNLPRAANIHTAVCMWISKQGTASVVDVRLQRHVDLRQNIGYALLLLWLVVSPLQQTMNDAGAVILLWQTAGFPSRTGSPLGAQLGETHNQHQSVHNLVLLPD